MAITAKFEADFNQFVGEVKRADTALAGMGTSATKVTTEATSSFNNMGSTVRNLASAFGVGFSIGAVVQFGRSVLAAGDAIQKMADQTGLSLAEVQKLQYVAGQSGTSIQSLVGAVQMLQQRLGDDSTGAAGAMRKLNINMAEFATATPYQQVTTLAEAIRKVEDPTERASVAAAIFGRAWREILPAIVAGMKDVGDQAPIMSDAAVKAADAAGDALDRMGRRAIVAGGTLFENLEKIIGLFRGDFSNAGLNVGLKEYATNAGALATALANVKPPVVAVTDSFGALGLSASEAAKMERELTASAEASIKVHLAAAEAVDKQAAAIKRMKDSAAVFIDLQVPDVKPLDFGPGGKDESRATGAYKLILDEATANREHAESLALVETQMKENLILVGDYATANTAAGAAATAATNEAVFGYAAVGQQVAVTGDAIRAYIELMKYSTAANAILKENSLFTSRSQLERISQIPTGGGGTGGGGTVINNNNIAIHDSFLDTPDGVQRMASKLGGALTAGQASRGRQVS